MAPKSEVKTLPSTEFRKVYAALETPTEVTVNGHLIGTWFPVGKTMFDKDVVRWMEDPEFAAGFAQANAELAGFGTPSPAPKPGRKK